LFLATTTEFILAVGTVKVKKKNQH